MNVISGCNPAQTSQKLAPPHSALRAGQSASAAATEVDIVDDNKYFCVHVDSGSGRTKNTGALYEAGQS